MAEKPGVGPRLHNGGRPDDDQRERRPDYNQSVHATTNWIIPGLGLLVRNIIVWRSVQIVLRKILLD